LPVGPIGDWKLGELEGTIKDHTRAVLDVDRGGELIVVVLSIKSYI